MRQIRTAIAIIFLTNFMMTLGLGLWEPVFSNFAIEELGIRADQIGIIHSLREVPGLMGFAVGILALVLVEIKISGLAIIVMGAGILLTAFTGGFWSLTAATVLMSVGFHFFYSSNAAALLMLVDTQEGPKQLGKMNSWGAVATILSSVIIFVALGKWGYRMLFLVIGGAVVLGGLILLPFEKQPAHIKRERRRVKLRRRYWLYYALEFLLGSRRHIATTFAVFLLARDYAVNAQVITLLFLLNNLIGTYLHQAFGKGIARFGERRVLVVTYTILTVVFMCYAFVPRMPALAAPAIQLPALRAGDWVFVPALTATPAILILLIAFIVDRLSMASTIAINSYFQKIAVGPEEITPNVSLGQTINHIAAVVVPVTGGFLWATIGPQSTFIAGVAIVLACLILTFWMRTPLSAVGPQLVQKTQPAD